MEIYERIKDLRKNCLNLTQEEFSQKINISRANLGNIETNRIKITERVMLDICSTYNINYEWLTTGNGEMEISSDESSLEKLFLELEKDYKLDNVDRDLIKNYLKLPDKHKSFIKDYIVSMIEVETKKYQDTLQNEAISDKPKTKKPIFNAEEIAEEIGDMAETEAKEYIKNNRAVKAMD